MDLKCGRCRKEWEYNGEILPKDFPQYVSCPRCKTSIKIQNETHDNKRRAK